MNNLINKAHKYAQQFYSHNPGVDVYLKLKEEIEEFITAYLLNETSDINDYEDFEAEIKDTIGDELADIALVVFAASKELGIDIVKHMEAKAEYNTTRNQQIEHT